MKQTVKIKLCGLSREADILMANRLRPDYIGFVFAPGSRRYVTKERAAALRRMLDPAIRAVGVFVNARPEEIISLWREGIIDMAQLHGAEDEGYIRRLREMAEDAGPEMIKAFTVEREEDAAAAMASSADLVLLDSGAGSGRTFDWRLVSLVTRPYFLAGGLDPENVETAVRTLHPYAVDVSSGIETEGHKDGGKMERFVRIVRSCLPEDEAGK